MVRSLRIPLTWGELLTTIAATVVVLVLLGLVVKVRAPQLREAICTPGAH